MNEVTCNECGRVHMGITRQYMEAQIADFTEYYDSLPEQQKQLVYGGRNKMLESYMHCFGCGNSYTNFRATKSDDCPMGSTISAILHFGE